MSRKPSMSRYERIRQGLPVCASDDGCDRAPTPGRRGMCRRCYEGSPLVPHPADGRGHPPLMGDPVQVGLSMERTHRAAIQELAKGLRISASEWIRRVVAEAIQKPCSGSSGNVGSTGTASNSER